MRKFLKGDGPDFRRLDVNGLLRRLQPFLRGGTSDAKVAIRLDLEEALPNVVADRLQIQEVLHNPIHNDQEANRARLADTPPPVIVQTRSTEDKVLISVVDAGPGLPETMDMDVIVRPFFTTKEDGVGLGLWIAYSIVEGHGGRLDARNNTHEPGATFQIRLPRE
ncbi:sensor histidine kinase [Thiohalorhabdus sp. Cl-TMA]|uniref:histidine kinase n=1 Tax=Thiohalorhabdus methylotrophus TaxID=3242694 RepID=A0ABV4TV34_9GAMM